MDNLKKAVNQLSGTWPKSESIAVNYGFFIHRDCLLDCAMNHICTRVEFELCAKELGYVVKFRYGVEYPTFGKRPPLTSDIKVKFKRKDGSWNENDGWVSSFSWLQSSAFKIVDQRYKSKEETLSNERFGESPPTLPRDSLVKFDDHSFLPAVGSSCVFNGEDSPSDLLRSIHGKVVYIIMHEKSQFSDRIKAVFRYSDNDGSTRYHATVSGRFHEIKINISESEGA